MGNCTRMLWQSDNTKREPGCEIVVIMSTLLSFLFRSSAEFSSLVSFTLCGSLVHPSCCLLFYAFDLSFQPPNSDQEIYQASIAICISYLLSFVRFFRRAASCALCFARVGGYILLKSWIFILFYTAEHTYTQWRQRMPPFTATRRNKLFQSFQVSFNHISQPQTQFSHVSCHHLILRIDTSYTPPRSRHLPQLMTGIIRSFFLIDHAILNLMFGSSTLSLQDQSLRYLRWKGIY